MKRSHWMRLMGLFVALTLLFPALPVAAGTPSFSPDFDGDGITDDIETAGWYNLLGTSFSTDPLDADSDDDGLTDGEEKLFGTNPNSDRSPGLYARYEDSFLTREYFSTTDTAYFAALRGGDRYIMTEAMVLRRGSTLQIGGPRDASLSITSNGLTSLSTSENVADGGWKITIPSTAKAGIYTATLSLSGWSDSLPLYVIYQLPTPQSSSSYLSNLTEEAIERFAYDDDPDDIRDEISVWFYTPEWYYYQTCGSAPCSSDPYGVKRGHAQAFYTDQFKKYVLRKYTMSAIEGTSTQSAAVSALLTKADWEFRTNYASIRKNFYDAMYRWDDGTGITMEGGGCESNSGVLTTLLRSAGFVARPFLVDWNKTPGHGESGHIGTDYQYDHSVLVWYNNSWKGTRSYASVGDIYYPWNEGVKSPTSSLYKYYLDQPGDLIISVNELWEQERKENEILRGTVNVGYVKPSDLEMGSDYLGTRDYLWDARFPLEIEQSPAIDVLAYETWHGDDWAPIEWGFEADGVTPKDPTQTYGLPYGVPAYPGDKENWPYNPVPTSCAPSVPDDVCDAFIEGWGATHVTSQQSSSLPASQETFEVFLPLVQAAGQTTLNSVRLGDVVRDYGVDLDGNGRFDQLVVEVEVSVSRAGTYQIGGWLQAGDQVLPAQTDRIYLNSRYLNSKSQVVEFVFKGEDLGRTEAAGPYTVLELWAGEAEQLAVAGAEPAAGTYDWQEPLYSTAVYPADAFETMDALFVDEFSHRGVDADGDGSYESLAIDVALDLAYSGSYKVSGDLYDGEGNYLGEDVWEGTGATAVLQFPIAKTSAPYKLDHLRLFNAEGRLLDSRYVEVYAIPELEGVAGSMVSLTTETTAVSDEFSTLGASQTGVFTTTLVDNALKITMGVTVDAPGGTYRVEGLLVDERDNPVAWSVSDPQSLAAGSGEMTLTFAGPLLYDHMLHEPASQSFKLVAVKIFSGNLSSATLEDSVNVATTTPAYTRDDFDPANGALVFFEDDMEDGTGGWSWTSSVWSLGTSVWHSWFHAWRAGTYDGSLSLASDLPVNLSDYVGPYLRFRTAYDLGSSDAGYLQVSRDGGAWTTVESYTDETPHWATEWVDLSSLGESSTARFRFNVDGSSGTAWYVDDVSFIGWPAVKEASFIYQAPDPILTGQEVTFVASYDSISTTLPITYTWDFNDGTPLLSTDTPTVTHVYQAGDDYTVGLTVENPYDEAAASDSFSVYEALTDVSFTLGSVTPDSDWGAVFTAVYTPTTATQPVIHTWNFGDGSAPVVTSDPAVTHTYTSGTYTVWVTSENGYGDPVTYSDDVVVPLDNDGDGLVNSVEAGIGTDPDNGDSDDDGVPDDVEVGDPEDPTDSDGDGTIDALDPDDDDDGIPTVDEGTGDPDGDDIPNYLDPDSDGDGIPDETEGTGDPDDDDIPNYLDLDSDGDGISDETEGTGDPDDDDIPNYLDPDSDGDSIPDETEGTGNPDGDSTPNYLDTDSDGDGIPDETEGTGNPDGDSLPNYLDTDSDGDGIPDATEGTGDADTDGTPNYLDTDSDGDGIPDATEGTGNPDNDSLPNYLDTDSDGDGIPDATEGTGNPDGDSRPNYLDTDSDGDGISDQDEGTGDSDGDGTPNYLDTDSDDDGIPDETEGTGNPDGDSLPNYLDTDSDGDGIPDETEGTGNPDGDGLPNYLDTDSDGDGIPDETEGTGNPDGDSLPNYLDPDSDGDGIPDATEGTGNPDGDSLPNYLDTDSDDDGIPDATEGTGDPDDDDIPNYLDTDSDGDGIPDETEGTSDTDGDGLPNYRDDDDDDDGALTEDEDVDDDGDPTNDDTDGDGVPDYLDDDDDDDGIPTADEDVDGDGDPTNDDTDGDGVPDYRDDDDDGDGVPTADEDVDGSGDPTNDDTDGDGTPNYLDDDDDGDGIPTSDEDLNGDGDPTNDDTDGGSIPDYLDDDDDDDGIPTADEDVDGDGDPTNDDTDGDGTPDYRDDDDDGDGIPTADEDVDGDSDPTNDDTDGDGVPNYRDDDDDGDGVPTIDEEITGDVDGDGIPDYLDNNYNPSFTSAATLAATEDVAYAYAITTMDPDAGEQLTITARVKPSWLTLVDHKNGTATLSGTPTNDHVGDNRVTLRVTDSKGAMAAQTFTITVANVNDTPVAVDDAVIGYRNYASEVDVLENDHDPDAGDTLTIESYDVTTAEGGTVSCSATLCTYTPLHGYDGLDTFSYTVRDLVGATDTATVTITVTTQVPGLGYVLYMPMVLR